MSPPACLTLLSLRPAASYHTRSKAWHATDLILLFFEITEASIGSSISEYNPKLKLKPLVKGEVNNDSIITARGLFSLAAATRELRSKIQCIKIQTF